MREYPYTIDNGAGERLTFLRRTDDPAGGSLEGEARVAPGAGPPMHVHHLQEEGFTVIQGRIGYQVAGQEPGFAEAGETVVFPAGRAHRFWNAGEDELRCEAYIRPAGNADYFLEALFASQKANGGQMPSLFDVAFLAQRYRTEYAMVGIPAPVQRLVFPALVRIGRLLGRYDRYFDAPEPMRR